MATKLSRLSEKLTKLATKIKKEPKDWVLFASVQATEIIKSRLFTNQGGRSTDGTLLPQYSPGYLKHNKYGKRKTSTRWDLIATGDLMGSIKPFIRKDTGGVRIARTQLSKADDLEKRSGKTIFEFSKDEMKEVTERVVKEIKIDVRRMVKESFK